MLEDYRPQICFESLYLFLGKKIVLHQDSGKGFVRGCLRMYSVFMLLKLLKLEQFIPAVPSFSLEF